MVKIIDGEIVQDDDPRAIEWENRQRRNQGWNDPRLRGGNGSQQGPNTNPSYGNAFARMGAPSGGGGQDVQNRGESPFQGINQKLSEFGLRPWSIGEYVVEPIFTVALILALVLYGFPGLVVVGVIWFVFGRTQRQA